MLRYMLGRLWLVLVVLSLSGLSCFDVFSEACAVAGSCLIPSVLVPRYCFDGFVR